MKCPYCGEYAEYVDSEIIYGKSYGMVYLCKPCDAYVGVHEGTCHPLGRLANAELRKYKIQAHAYFDPLYKRKMEKGYSKGKARSKAYQWLSREMGIPAHETHIGMFDVGQCKKVIEVCSKYVKLEDI